MLMPTKKATIINLVTNIFLFIIKLIAGLMSNSIAIISDAINSFTDIVTSFAVMYTVKLARKKPDSNHPFGHHRAEPIAGLVIAVFASILGFEIMRSSLVRFFNKEAIVLGYVAFGVTIVAVVIKIILTLYLRTVGKRHRSPALVAAGIDSRNDVLSSFVVLIGITGYYFGITYLDAIAGILIGIYIIKSGFDIGRENVDYLMGKSPNKKYYRKLHQLGESVKGVIGVHDLKIHYVGNYFHAEIHIEVDGKIKTSESHKIAIAVQKKLEALEEVDRVFVHVDAA